MISPRQHAAHRLRRCPTCDDFVPQDAIRCRYCGGTLERAVRDSEGSRESPTDSSPTGAENIEPDSLGGEWPEIPEPLGKVSAMAGLTWTEADFERISQPRRANQAPHPPLEHTYEPWPEPDDYDGDSVGIAKRRTRAWRTILMVSALTFVAAVIYFGPSYLRSVISDRVETAMQKIARAPIGSPNATFEQSAQRAVPSATAYALQGRDTASANGGSSVTLDSEHPRTNLPSMGGRDAGGSDAKAAAPPNPVPPAPATTMPARSADQIVASVSHTDGAALVGPKSDEKHGVREHRPNGAGNGSGVTATGKQVRQIQVLLAGFGYYRYRIDGVEGPETRAAIRWFQIHYGLRQTGRSSRSLLRALERARVAANRQTNRERFQAGR